MTSSKEARSTTDAVGILFGRDRLSGCRASRTMFGTFKYQHTTVAIVGDDTDAALTSLLQELGASPTSPLPIAAAIPTDECYFATRPTSGNAANASPRVLLRESLRSTGSRLDQLAIDVINWQPDRRAVAGIVAAPSSRIEFIRESVAATGHSLQRLEPAAACLVGVAPDREGRDRRNSLTTRILLGESTLLAVTCRGGRPVYWQSLPLPPGDEATGIVSAVRSLEAAGSACGLDRTPDQVVVHGRDELMPLLDQQWLKDNVDCDFRWIDSPTLAGRDVAQALADQFLSDVDDSFDFIRQHRDPLQLRRVVPHREILAYVVAACVLAAVMWLRLTTVENEQASVITTAPPMIADGTNPKPERDRLNARATAVSQFLDKRVMWSGVLGDVTRAMPEGMRLTSIRGSAAMAQRRKKQVKASPTMLVLQAETALDETGAMPKELDTLAEKIHSIESIVKHFKSVELSDVRRTLAQETGVSGAEFSIVLTTDAKGGS